MYKNKNHQPNTVASNKEELFKTPIDSFHSPGFTLQERLYTANSKEPSTHDQIEALHNQFKDRE